MGCGLLGRLHQDEVGHSSKMKVELSRFAFTPMGVFGRLTVVQGVTPTFSCFTVERPWMDNEPSVSCIPAGSYALKLGMYHRGGYPAYSLVKVPGRSLIKVHAGNTMMDLMGCIAPGMNLGHVHGRWAVTSSKQALGTFMGRLQGATELHITITDCTIDTQL